MRLMKGLFLLSAILVFPFVSSTLSWIKPRPFADPTGTYILKGTIKKNRIIGHSGEIRVKLLQEGKIALCFFINAGYPGYESGSFLDTLSYNDDRAVYKPTLDPGCSILFCFNNHDVEIVQLYSDPDSKCGFGMGVMISAVFQKYSEDIPIIQDLSRASG
jgi:hypothetical protein